MTTPTTELDEENMREAIAEASLAASEGRMPFGSVLSDVNGKILFRARNQCQQAKKRGGGVGDVTRHAEMELVRMFTTQLPTEQRASCTLYTSTEPCVMCAGAIYWSGGKSWHLENPLQNYFFGELFFSFYSFNF